MARDSKSLVIVESPAKARTINKYLGRDFTVKASMGHVRDLPRQKLAVDVKRNFKAEYEVIKGREKVLADLRKTAKASKAIYLAADPDREGEAICWHLGEELKPAKRPIYRVHFNEITQRAIQEAFRHPGPIDARKVDAQQARRILDRLVGYKLSPLLWEKVRRGISAGRVQSVALRLVVDREAEIRAFVPVEYWSIEARLAAALPPEFTARLRRIDGEKVALGDAAAAERVVQEVRGTTFRVAQVLRKEKRRNPVPPFITSKLQQEAARKLHFTARKTMQIAQQLYEGIELGAEGSVGLITYMRTDSPRVSPEAAGAARDLIATRYGRDFLPDRPPTYKSPRGAQEAHEAIRPTAVEQNPSSVAPFLTRDQLELYTLIWNRFVASQMRPAVFDTTTVDIAAGRAAFRATGMTMRFPGFMQVYVEGRDEAAARRPEENGEVEPEEEEGERQLPPLEEGQMLECRGVTPSQHFTQPLPRFTEATLVKELEERGIGRPSTYATILSVIQNRDYAVKEGGRFKPTELGEIVVGLLCESFPRLMDYEFTARMEGTLDKIEEGEADWLKEMHRFYGAFSKWLTTAQDKMTNIKAMEEKTDIACDKCGRPMVIKWGRFGKFLACSGYPECKNTREVHQGGNGGPPAAAGGGEQAAAPGGAEPDVPPCENCGRPMVLKRGRFGPFLACSGYPECRTVRKLPRAGAAPGPPPQPTDERCEKCGSPMVIKEGRFGRFIACSAYPRCRHIKSIPVGVNCPQCGLPLTERRTKRGRTFFGCSGYPKCSFALWDRPLPEPCPLCGAPYLVEKRGRAGITIRCAADGCAYQRAPAEAAAAGTPPAKAAPPGG